MNYSTNGLLKWSIDEIMLLKSFYRNHSVLEIQDMLLKKLNSERSIKAISVRASLLGISKLTYSRLWSESDKNFLLENYYKLSIKEISLIMNRTYKSIYGFMSLNYPDLLNPKPIKIWSDIEILFLKNNYNVLTIGEIAKKLNCKYGVVRKKMIFLKLPITLYILSDNDKNYIIDNCSKYSVFDIATHLNRHHQTIRKFIYKHNLFELSTIKKYNLPIPWDKSKDELFIKIQSEHSIKELSYLFQCSICTISNKLKKFNIVRNHIHSFTSDDDKILIYYISQGLYAPEISKKMNRTIKNIKGRASFLGYKNISSYRVKLFSEDDFILISEKINDGFSYSEIALILDRSYESIRLYCKRNNIKRLCM